MHVVQFNKATIQSLNPSGMFYIDDQGNPQHIDFSICHTSWIRQLDMPIEQMSPQAADWHRRCVGRRNSIATPPYIEFLTDPLTRFEFGHPNDYGDLRSQLEQADCTTFDES
jgi:hypothetical protein